MSVEQCAKNLTKKNRKPGKKTRQCESIKDISRLTKHRLCSYIMTHPSQVYEGRVVKKDWLEPPKAEMNAIMGRFFTPKTVKEYVGGHIPDYARILYLARYFGAERDAALFTVKGSLDNTKVLWSNEEPITEKVMEEPTLQISDDLIPFLKKNEKKRLVFALLRLYINHDDGDDSAHSNFLTFDIKHKIMYRYEPSGLGLYDIFSMDALDDALIAWAKQIGFKYEAPWESCPRQMLAKAAAVQRLAFNKEKRPEKDPHGFCKVWSLFMMEQKIRNPEISFDKLHDLVIKHFLSTNVDMTEFARRFSSRVIETANDMLLLHGYKGKQEDREAAGKYMEKHWGSIMSLAMLSK